MGYQSDVHLLISKKALLALSLHGHNTSCLREAREEDFYHGDHKDCEYYVWQDTKWYSSFSAHVAVEDLMDTLDELENNQSHKSWEPYYGFIRIGDDLGDIEIRGTPEELDMYLSRTVEFY